MERPVRILHVLGTLNRGGAETMVMNLYRNINRSKIQFDFVKHTTEKCDYDEEIYKLGGRIFSISRYKGKNHFIYKKEWQKLFTDNHDYKIIHGHMRSTAAIYLKIAKKYGLITIAHSHSTASRGNRIQILIKNIMQYPIRYIADYLFACSNEAGKWLFGKKAVKKNNYRILKNAIDIKKFSYNNDIRNEIRKKLNIENKFVIGHVGSFTYPKNHKFLINVFQQVVRKNKNAMLLLIGDGEKRKSIEKQIYELGIQDNVILTGVISNVNDYMQAMDVFVFPSKYEGLGLVIIEAQAAGLQCIVSDSIPEEVYITEYVHQVGLRDLHKKWINEIFKYNICYGRKNTYENIKRNGYDICCMSKKLEKFYLELWC